MLVLNEEKENLLVKQYGFKEYKAESKHKYYKYGVSFTIYGADYYNKPLQVNLSSFSKKNQDMLYLLIMEDVLIYVEEGNDIFEIIKLKKQIRGLQKELEDLENKKEVD